MIVALELPPGAYRNGTEYQAKGRWRDVNLVRWHEGAMRPVGGWDAYPSLSVGSADFTYGGPRGAMAWTDASGNNRLIWGTEDQAYVMLSSGAIWDLTPAGYSGGNTDSSTWQWGTFGEIPVGCGRSDGRLWEWDLNTANDLTAITNAPTGCNGLVVTAERFIMALGDGGDPRSIRWCDRENRTVWTAATTNQAGDWDLETEGEIMFALQMRGETLIVTTKDAWTARYVGYPDVYAFTRIGTCTAVGGICGIRVNDRAYWMGERAFYVYSGGYVQQLPCEIGDFLFADIDDNDAFGGTKRKIAAWHNSEYNEAWWHYESVGSALNSLDKYVAYNHAENHWSYGLSPFGCVVDKGPFDAPLGLLDEGNVGNPFLINHDYSSDPGYTLGTNWRVAGGVLDQSAPAASTASYSVAALSGGDYFLRVIVANRTAGTLTIRFGSSTTTATNGTQFFTLVANSNPELLEFVGDGVWDGDITWTIVTRSQVMMLETGVVHETALEEYAETGPLDVGDGDRRVHVVQVIPDQQDSGEIALTFKSREYPNGSETTHTAVTAANPTDVRFSGRQFKMKVAPVAAADWRSGVHRLDIVQGGRR